MWFERQAPYGYGPAFQGASEMFFYSFNKFCFLSGINVHYRFEDLKFVFNVSGRFCEGLHIFRETTSAVANARKQKALSYPAVSSYSFSHRINISANELAQISDLIHKR